MQIGDELTICFQAKLASNLTAGEFIKVEIDMPNGLHDTCWVPKSSVILNNEEALRAILSN